jgi:hypothetical protein
VLSAEQPASAGRSFYAGRELGIEDAAEVMRSTYCKVVGLVGLADVGKTSFLTAIYLLACCEQLSGFRFAGSRTLQGFEERARLLRKWDNATLPTQLAIRTTRQELRQGGLLHLRLATEDGPVDTTDILLSDVPGDWFKDLIRHHELAERVAFLKRADALIFLVDAERLLSPGQRSQELHSARLLLERLVHDVGVRPDIPFIFAVSKIDANGRVDAITGEGELIKAAEAFGLKPTLVRCASFSRCPADVPSGYGVPEILRAALDVEYELVVQQRAAREPASDRSFERFVAKKAEA